MILDSLLMNISLSHFNDSWKIYTCLILMKCELYHHLVFKTSTNISVYLRVIVESTIQLSFINVLRIKTWTRICQHWLNVTESVYPLLFPTSKWLNVRTSLWVTEMWAEELFIHPSPSHLSHLTYKDFSQFDHFSLRLLSNMTTPWYKNMPAIVYSEKNYHTDKLTPNTHNVNDNINFDQYTNQMLDKNAQHVPEGI